MNSLKINMFTRNACFQYSHRAVSVITAFTLVFATSAFALPQIALATAVPMCNGLPATIYVEGGFIVSDIPADNGDPYTGTLNGDSSDDVIVGTSGNDIINAGSGNNTICSLDGNDTVDATGGHDWISAAEGNNVVDAGSGNNTITAGNGNNTIDSEGGDDSITTGSGNDDIDAGSGSNTINAGDGNNTIDSEGGSDSITTGSGNDDIDAGSGSNTINAGNGNNEITTAGGTDILTTGTGNDIIKAGSGANTVNSGGGHDSIDGDGGADIFNAGAGYDFCDAGSGSNTLTNCEVTGGTEGIIIAKEATPEGSQSFSFTGGLGSFSLVDDGVTSNYSFFNPSNATYTVEETVPSGWDLTSISCWDPSNGTTTDLEDGEAVIDFDNNEGIVCTFTNTQNPPTLIVNKVIVNDDEGTVTDEESFSFTINDDDAIAFEADGSNEVTVEAGSYEVVEEEAEGYTAGYSSDCEGTIAAGETKTCTITNDDEEAPAPDPVTIVVSPSNMNGWDEANYEDPAGEVGAATTDSGTNSIFVAGPDVAPIGIGSAGQIVGTDGNDVTRLRTAAHNGALLSSLSSLSYSTYVTDNQDAQAPYVRLRIDRDGNGSTDDSLFFEPVYQNGTYSMLWSQPAVANQCGANPACVTLDTWQTWDLDAGAWWSENDSAGGPPLTTLAGYLAQYPGSKLATDGPAIRIQSGGGAPTWSDFDGNFDEFVFNHITYDFEPDGDMLAPDMPVHLWPADGSVMPSSFLTHIDWTDVTDESEPVVYYYESALSSATSTTVYGDDFTAPIYQSGTLAISEIPTLGTGEGTYFWHVRAVDDEGNSTPWTAPWSVTVDNTPPDVTVTIVKYIDDEHASAENTDSASFPMYAIFPGGEGNYSLTTTGFNNPNAYEATTSNMPWGSDYSTYEITSVEGPVYPVGEDCPIDSFRLVGYKTGNTLEQAEADDISTDVPVFDDLMTSKYVIVVNEPCTMGESQIIQPTESEETSGTTELEAYYADENGDGNDGVQWAVRAGTCNAGTNTVFGNVDGKNTPFTWDGTNFNTTIDTTQVLNGSYCFIFNPTEDGGNANQRLTRTFSINNPLPDVKVHVYKYLQTDETTEQVPDEFEPATTFPMQASWDAENIGAGSGAYVLGNNHGGASLKYAADTSAMTSGADYSTYEDTYPGNSSSNVLAPTESCQVGYYKLVGYKASETSLEDAEEASIFTSAPSFSNLESDAYVIVVNKYCGDEPEVTYADEVKMCKV
ncbi:MAG: calcium-binding protein, partial [Minisyncoccota bacterium]